MGRRRTSIYWYLLCSRGFLGGSESTCSVWFDPWVRKIPLEETVGHD